jgi:uncharacterized protein (TIGR03032 family)
MKTETEDPNPLRSSHTTSLTEFLKQAGMSFLVSTYQAGKLIMVRADGDTTNTHFRSLRSPMGIAHDGGKLVVGTQVAIKEFHNQPPLAAKLEPAGKHDACFVPRQSIVTGQIAIHDVAWVGNEIWGVNTRFSCLCTFHKDYSFIPQWKPKFITKLAAEDRCHLNGLGLRNGKPAFVTALGETDTQGGWRENKARGGCLIDLASGEFISRGLSMPHSPRWYDSRLWVLESGAGTLCVVDLDTGKLQTVAYLPGFTRGLDFVGPFALIGLSQVRESALFSGIPITDRLKVEDRKCGVWVVDTRTGQTVAFLDFLAGVQEIFAVQVLPGTRFPEVFTEEDDDIQHTFMLPDEFLPATA